MGANRMKFYCNIKSYIVTFSAGFDLMSMALNFVTYKGRKIEMHFFGIMP